MSQTHIRPLSADEWPLFKELRLRSLAESPHAFGSSHEKECEKKDSYWQKLVKGNKNSTPSEFLVALHDDEAIGLVFCFQDKEDPSEARLGGIWVSPEMREHGIGSLLMEMSISWAQNCGCKCLKLWNVDQNEAALKLYEKLGFHQSGKKQAHPLYPELSLHEHILDFLRDQDS